MSHEPTSDGDHTEVLDDVYAPAHFVGVMALVLMAAALLVVAIVLLEAVTHH